ncbi:hypothetical protein ACHAO7_004512 [Fusarium culmorum]
MEVITFFVILSVAIAFIANDPIQTPFGAIFASFFVAFFALIGGASFINHVIISVQERLVVPPEDDIFSRPSLRRVTGYGPAEFDTHDKFYHTYGICCGKKGHCHSCLKQHAEQLRDEQVEDKFEFNRKIKQALAE